MTHGRRTESTLDKTCAYCGRTGKFTSEHIWPDWLLQRTSYTRAFSARAGRIVGRKQTINDVCAPCNNGPLSVLDGGVSQLYDAYFKNWVAEGQAIDFAYDHGKLLRWLLKVTYNSARTTGRDAALLARYREVMIAEGNCTPLFAFGFVGTIKPFYVLDPGAVKFRAIQPEGARCGRVIIPGHETDTRFSTRMITLNAFFFSLLIINDDEMHPDEIGALIPKIYGATLLPTGKTVIPPPTMNTFDAMRGVESWPEARPY